MNKTIKASMAASAFAASMLATQANALMVETDDVYESVTYCLKTYGQEGAKYAVYCDDSKNNEINNRPLQANGCFDDQVAIRTSRNVTQKEEFAIVIQECYVKIDGEIEPAQL